MKIVKIVLSILAVVALVAAFMAPIGPMPGFLIGGTDSDVPANWGNTQPIHEIQLQVNAGPMGRTVIIWMVQMDGDLYVLGDRESGWPQAIGSGGPVRMMMQGNRYELNATPVTDGAAEVAAAWLAKYTPDYPEITQGFSESSGNAAIFRLTAR